jgi:hypothetical protein
LHFSRDVSIILDMIDIKEQYPIFVPGFNRMTFSLNETLGQPNRSYTRVHRPTDCRN